MNGHELCDRVVAAFPSLKAFRSHDQLLMKIVDTVMLELPRLLPTDLLDAFESLLENDGGGDTSAKP